jgi:hypothetical protein
VKAVPRHRTPKWALAALLPLIQATGCARSTAEKIGVQSGPEPVPIIECRRTEEPLKLDGRLDEPAWKKAQIVREFMVARRDRPPKTATSVRFLWDSKYIYFAAEMDDTDLYADVTKRNGMTWSNDVIELFLKPSEQKLAYYEFQVNAANTPLELFFPSRGSGGWQRFGPLTHIGLESVTKLRGTLNNWRDKDEGWTVEARIPWADFVETGGAPRPGDTWRYASCRYDYSVSFEHIELSSTAPVGGDFHSYENYERMKFVGR